MRLHDHDSSRCLCWPALLLVGCGALHSPTESSDTSATTGSSFDAGALASTATADAQPVAPRSYNAIPLADGDRPCTSEHDCSAGELCQSPESASWNFCGAPREADCPAGWIGDSCGHCFQGCSDSECPAGTECNGSYCMSPLRCAAFRPAPP